MVVSVVMVVEVVMLANALWRVVVQGQRSLTDNTKQNASWCLIRQEVKPIVPYCPKE